MPNPVHIPSFAIALIAAPLLPGLSAIAVVALLALVEVNTFALALPFAFVAVGTVIGAPIYLLFGGPAFYLALRRFGPAADMGPPAVHANLAASPILLGGYLLFEGVSLETVIVTVVFVLLGCAFGWVWGHIFSRMYTGLLERSAA